jgi:pup-like protein
MNQPTPQDDSLFDDLLDELEALAGDDAQAFVSGFVQKGGE